MPDITDPVLAALLVGVLGPVILFALGRAFGGRRKDTISEWKDWAEEQGRRIDRLEGRVEVLEQELEEERATNKALEALNTRQASMLTALVRWAILLRDEVMRHGGTVPAAPVDVEAALTNLNPSS